MRLIKKSEFARLAKTKSAVITNKFKGKNADCLIDNQVDLDHPVVIDFLKSRGVTNIPSENVVEVNPIETKEDKIEDFEDLTLRQIVMRYGSFEGFNRYIQSIKTIAEYKNRELRNQTQRKEVVERERVATLVFSIIDIAFSRLVSDVPNAVSKLVIARCDSGGTDTPADVERIIREANSRVLKNLKEHIETMELLKDEN